VSKRKKFILIVVVVLLLSCVLLMAIGSLLPEGEPRPTRTPKPTNTPRPTATAKLTNTPRPTRTPKPDVGDDLDAIIMCEQFITDRLISPTTAEFPSFRDQRVEQQDDVTWIVWSYVDAQNRFGAMIRTRYWCEVKYLGNERWRLIDYELYE
jgi:hypothetical protein